MIHDLSVMLSRELMELEFTEQELKRGRKLVANYDKLKSRWGLLAGFFLVITLIYGASFGIAVQNIIEANEKTSTLHSGTDIPDSVSMKEYIDLRVSISDNRQENAVLAMLSGIVLILMMINIILLWNKIRMEPMHVKMYRAYFQRLDLPNSNQKTEQSEA